MPRPISVGDSAWIEGVGWGLGLVFLSGVALALLSIPLLSRGRAAKRPGLNWKQSALLAGIAGMFLVGLSNGASSEPERAGSESLVLEGPGSQLDARDADEEILALRPGTSAESVMEKLGPPVSVHLLEDESTFYYDTWQLTFIGDGLRDRLNTHCVSSSSHFRLLNAGIECSAGKFGTFDPAPRSRL